MVLAFIMCDKVCGVNNADAVGLFHLDVKDERLNVTPLLGPDMTASSIHEDGLGVEDPVNRLRE